MSAYKIELEGPVPDGMHRAFQDMIQKQQTSMHKVSQEHKQMALKVQQLEAENRNLLNENQALKGQIASMGAEPNNVPAVPVPTIVGVPTQTGRPDRQGWENNSNSAQDEPFHFVRKIKNHEQPVHSVCMDMNSEVIASASWDGTIKLYNLETEEVVRTLEEDGGEKMLGLYAVAFAQMDPKVLGCTSCDNYVYLWEHGTGKMLKKLAGHQNEVNGLDFHPSREVLCSASDDCKALVWDFQEGIVLRTLDKHTQAVYGTSFLGEENQYLVATCCFDQKTRVFDMRNKDLVQMLQGHEDDVIGIDYSSNQRLLATGSDDGSIRIYDTNKWKLMHAINTNNDPSLTSNEVKRVAFSQDGEFLAAACSTGRVLVYNISNPSQPHAILKGHDDCVFDITWGKSKRGERMLVSASHDHTCNYWKEGPPPSQ